MSGILKTRIKHTGDFSLSKLLGTVRGFLGKHGYDIQEKTYKHKGDDVEYEIIGSKRVNPYLEYEITFETKIIDFKDKGETDEGRVRIETSSNMNFDWQGKFKGGMWGEIQEFMHRYIIKQKIKTKWVGAIYEENFAFNQKIRESLGMETVL